MSAAPIDVVCRALDRLVDAGERHGGLFPSVLNLDGSDRHRLPPAIPGQRDSDRSFPGSNLMHDHPTLRVLVALAEALGRSAYSAAVDRYLRRFVHHCASTPSGLFPWGEHSFWNYLEDRVGNSYALARSASGITHDHLLQAPLWLWDRLWAIEPNCVIRFAEGLDNHWRAGDPVEYNRHAWLMESGRGTERGPRSCDFPRHSGFYLLDWAFAYAHTGWVSFFHQMERMLDYWWQRRSESGLLPIESRTPPDAVEWYGIDSAGQTLSLAVSLMEAADRLGTASPLLSSRMQERAATYREAFLKAQQDLDSGDLVLSVDRASGAPRGTAVVWGSRYGNQTAGAYGLLCCGVVRLTGDSRFLRLAEAVGRRYATETFPTGAAVPAKDGGLALGLLAELYAITSDDRWLDAGRSLAERLVPAYFDQPLPRGAAGIDWYESQMLPGYLLHGLARIALLAERGIAGCPLQADLTNR